jgi:hypothetical protein
LARAARSAWGVRAYPTWATVRVTTWTLASSTTTTSELATRASSIESPACAVLPRVTYRTDLTTTPSFTDRTLPAGGP